MFEDLLMLGILVCLLAIVAITLLAIRRRTAGKSPAPYHIYYTVERSTNGAPIVCYLVATYAGEEDPNVGVRVTRRGVGSYIEAVSAATACGEEHQKDVNTALQSISDPASYYPDPRPIDPR